MKLAMRLRWVLQWACLVVSHWGSLQIVVVIPAITGVAAHGVVTTKATKNIRNT